MEAPAEPDISVREVLQAVRAASGGDAWDGVQQIDAQGSIVAVGSSGKIESSHSLIDARSLVQIHLGALELSSGHDGALPWSRNASGLVDVLESDREVADAISRSFLTSHAYLRTQPAELAADLRAEQRAARSYQVVSLTPPGGEPLELWVDAATSLIEQVVFPREQWTEEWTDYRRVGDLLLPHQLIGSDGKRHEQTIAISSYRLRETVDAQRFRRPASRVTDAKLRHPISMAATIQNGHVSVKASINGSRPLRFILDTGASVNILTPAAAILLGIQPGGQLTGTGVGENAVPMHRAKVSHLKIGTAAMTNQHFAVAPLPPLTVVTGDTSEPVAGLLGYDFFRRFVVGIDYNEHRVSLAPLLPCSRDDIAAAKLHFDARIPRVEAMLDGVPGRWIVDTGNAGSSLITAQMADHLGIPADAGSQYLRNGGVGGTFEVRALRFASLLIGGQLFHEPVLGITSQTSGALADSRVAGTLGYSQLRQLAPTFDYECRRLSVRAIRPLAPDAYDRAGLIWNIRNTVALEVLSVAPGSPAAAAGIRRGDALLQLNGKVTTHFKPEQWREISQRAAGTKVALVMQRGEQAYETEMTLRDFIPSRSPPSPVAHARDVSR
jgi:predicted aspartyl protease